MPGPHPSDPLQPTEEDYLISVGKAVALLWRYMPEAMQEAILNQAETLSYRPSVSAAREQLRSFLETYNAGEGERKQD